jgi:hypothetical protein
MGRRSMLAQLRTRHKAKSECLCLLCVLVTVFNRPMMGERVLGNDKCVVYVRYQSRGQRSRMKTQREHANCPPQPALLPPAVSPCENLLLAVPAHTIASGSPLDVPTLHCAAVQHLHIFSDSHTNKWSVYCSTVYNVRSFLHDQSDANYTFRCVNWSNKR